MNTMNTIPPPQTMETVDLVDPFRELASIKWKIATTSQKASPNVATTTQMASPNVDCGVLCEVVGELLTFCCV
jgi:hypothetical protein